MISNKHNFKLEKKERDSYSTDSLLVSVFFFLAEGFPGSARFRHPFFLAGSSGRKFRSIQLQSSCRRFNRLAIAPIKDTMKFMSKL